jgi:hypothetical protein
MLQILSSTLWYRGLSQGASTLCRHPEEDLTPRNLLINVISAPQPADQRSASWTGVVNLGPTAETGEPARRSLFRKLQVSERQRPTSAW